MTVNKLERSASLSLISEVLMGGGTVENNERRRRNGLGNIFEGMSHEDISKFQTYSTRINGRSLSCPCNKTKTTDGQKTLSSEPSVGKRRYHLLHNKRWSCRRNALGHIFAGIPSERIKDLLCCKRRQRRLALADIFTGIPQEDINKLLSVSTDISDHSDELKTETVRSHLDAKLCQRRCALGNIFIDIPAEEVQKLVSKKSITGCLDENAVVDDNENAIDNDVHCSKVTDWNIENSEESENGLNEELDFQTDIYMRAFFSSLMKQHHKQRLGYMMRTMSMPCYSQFDMEQQMSTYRRRNGQWDVLNTVTCQDYNSLKGQYVSSVVFATC